MKTEILFDTDLIRYFHSNNLIYKGGDIADEADDCRGFAHISQQTALLNLSAFQWRTFQTEERLIEELTNTIVHEHIHLLIGTESIPIRFTPPGEERVCHLLANQG